MAKYNVLREEYHHHHHHQSNHPNQNEKLNQIKFIFRLFSLSLIIVLLLGLLLLCLTIFFTKYFQLEHNYSIIPLELSDNIINNNDYGDNNNVLNYVNYDSDDDDNEFNYNNYKNDNHNDNGFILINNQSIAADHDNNNNLNRKDLNTSHSIPYDNYNQNNANNNAVLDHDYNHGHFLNNNDSKMTNQSSIIMHHHHDQQQHEQVRLKRGVVSLASMIRCITRCNPLDYKDYGCYCGFQGEGYPIDQIDRCCYMHDICYENTDCNQALVYFVSYKWICKQNRRASCAYVINGNAKQNCAYQLCECDRKFAKCLSRQRCPKIKPSCREKRNIITSLSKLFI